MSDRCSCPPLPLDVVDVHVLALLDVLRGPADRDAVLDDLLPCVDVAQRQLVPEGHLGKQIDLDLGTPVHDPADGLGTRGQVADRYTDRILRSVDEEALVHGTCLSSWPPDVRGGVDGVNAAATIQSFARMLSSISPT